MGNESVTFRLRRGKIFECIVGAILCLVLSSFGIWTFWSGTDHSMLDFGVLLYVIIFFIIPISGTVGFSTSIVRTKLVLSSSGISFQKVFNSREYAWDRITGFYIFNSNGEVYLQIDLNKNPFAGIPLFWFEKFHSSKKSNKPNRVLASLFIFAPHLFADTQVIENNPGQDKK